MSRISFVEQKVGIYEIEAQSWQQDHKSAMMCFDLVEILHEGVHLYGIISRFDEAWHEWTYENPDKQTQDEFDFIDSRLIALYKRWLSSSKIALEDLFPRIADEFRSRGFEESLIGALKKNCSEVEAMLIRDAKPKILTGEIGKLRDKAIKAFRDGETVAMEEALN